MKRLLIILICVALSAGVYAQKKKEIKENKIKSITTWQGNKKDSKAEGYKLDYTLYDRSGRWLEKTEFKKDGSIDKKETVKYDAYDNKIEETDFDTKQGGSVNKKVTYKYNAKGDCIEEAEYKAGVLNTKSVYTYNANGQKTTEMVYDGAGNLQKKHVYTYNSKGMKETRQTYNKDGVLESGRQYLYEYY